MPKAGPGKLLAYPGGNATSSNSTSGCSEQLPNSMLASWEASFPVVAAASPSTTSKAPPGRTDSTLATTSPSTCGSRIASTGISTLCSAASARARASISLVGLQRDRWRAVATQSSVDLATMANLDDEYREYLVLDAYTTR